MLSIYQTFHNPGTPIPWVGLWYLTPLSTIFQLYRDGPMPWRKTQNPQVRHWCSIVYIIFTYVIHSTVDSRYLEFDGTMEKIWVNRSSTQEELRRYRKCGLFNDERETTRAKFWRAKTSIACPYSRNDFKHIRCFCCCFFLSVKFFEFCKTTDNF